MVSADLHRMRRIMIDRQWQKLKSFWKRTPKWAKVVVVFLLALLVCDPIKTAFNSVFAPDKIYEPAFKRIKNAIVQGPRSLVDQIPTNMTFDFQSGTLVVWIPGSSVSNHTPIQLQICSTEDNARMLTLHKDEDNLVSVRLNFPSLGAVERSSLLTIDDIVRKNLPFVGVNDVVFVAFVWDLKKMTSDLYVNARSTTTQ